MEHRAGIEPAGTGFADQLVSYFATGAQLASLKVELTACPAFRVYLFCLNGEILPSLRYRVEELYRSIYDVVLMPDQIADVFISASVKHLQLSEDGINRCLSRLSDEQMWYRGADHENSIANLLLHLEGNLRQWFLHGIDGRPDVRQRDEEFTLSPSRDCDEVRRCFAATLAESRKVIGSLAPERLLEMIDPQPTGNWGPMTILQAIYRIVGHLQLHTGQIIMLTKQLVGTDLDLSLPRKR